MKRRKSRVCELPDQQDVLNLIGCREVSKHEPQ